MLLIQVLTVLFAVFALTRVVSRFRRRVIGISEFLFWGGFWIAVSVLVTDPAVTQWFAKILGVGRGADAVFYVTLVALCYGLFRLQLKIRTQQHEITQLVRKLAIVEARKNERQ